MAELEIVKLALRYWKYLAVVAFVVALCVYFWHLNDAAYDRGFKQAQAQCDAANVQRKLDTALGQLDIAERGRKDAMDLAEKLGMKEVQIVTNTNTTIREIPQALKDIPQDGKCDLPQSAIDLINKARTGQ